MSLPTVPGSYEMPFEWDAYPGLPPGAGEIPAPPVQAGDPPSHDDDDSPQQLQ